MQRKNSKLESIERVLINISSKDRTTFILNSALQRHFSDRGKFCDSLMIFSREGSELEDHMLSQLSKMDLPNKARMCIQYYLKTAGKHSHLIRELAECFLKGQEAAVTLLGYPYSIQLVENDEELGFTDLDTRRIHVSPYPILKKVPRAPEIVEGLILHELGHHVYHRSTEAKEAWKRACKKGYHPFLNLVMDEHLERNLRAFSRQYGDRLKALNAYAFIHMKRVENIHEKLFVLGTRAFHVLSSIKLHPAYKRGHMVVGSNELLTRLADQGSSFARFMRALCMGQGKRWDDQKVAQAMKLFRKNFRHSTEETWEEIALQLREIFKEESKLAESLTGTSEIGRFPAAIESGPNGLDDDQIEEELKQLERERNSAQGQEQDQEGRFGIMVNEDENLDFRNELRHMSLQAPREDYLNAVGPLRAEARRLERHFAELGIQKRMAGGRTAGQFLDRGHLQTRLITGDPRLLKVRIPVRTASFHLGILVDCSGSMCAKDNIGKARQFALLIAEATRRLTNIECNFYGFTDTRFYRAGSSNTCSVTELDAGGGNNDAAALYHAAAIARRSRHSLRLLVMISDGLPTDCSVDALTHYVKRLTDEGFCCLQVAIESLDHICFPNYVEIHDASTRQAVQKFGRLIVEVAARHANL
jgi:Mg-chelatase subunit ChlD